VSMERHIVVANVSTVVPGTDRTARLRRKFG
jgi:hypothetical protein